ncbi:hypothetical protein M622_18780 [Thauera terpenica 58Eu]|uniref:UspA domain-containing protein n=1 Tax=Thauera terpenica 58Eu TaxID=1348657 RepID=T0AN92_9RHOO|nr:universal stress protein [Thauera terpenica]EPZ14344.1 hypothetical protein M622_18780 [Thauera terpenica 58Eu]
MFRHVLAPTDGSVLSEQAVKQAILFAQETGAKITFLFAVDDPETSIYGEASLLRSQNPELLARRTDAVTKGGRDLLANTCAAAQAAGVSSEAKLAMANEPFEAIVSEAEAGGCDLIIMASHGYRGVKSLILGSQTQKVLTHSRIPVLVYRQGG